LEGRKYTAMGREAGITGGRVSEIVKRGIRKLIKRFKIDPVTKASLRAALDKVPPSVDLFESGYFEDE
jgi:hypothetical protein